MGVMDIRRSRVLQNGSRLCRPCGATPVATGDAILKAATRVKKQDALGKALMARRQAIERVTTMAKQVADQADQLAGTLHLTGPNGETMEGQPEDDGYAVDDIIYTSATGDVDAATACESRELQASAQEVELTRQVGELQGKLKELEQRSRRRSMDKGQLMDVKVQEDDAAMEVKVQEQKEQELDTLKEQHQAALDTLNKQHQAAVDALKEEHHAHLRVVADEEEEQVRSVVANVTERAGEEAEDMVEMDRVTDLKALSIELSLIEKGDAMSYEFLHGELVSAYSATEKLVSSHTRLKGKMGEMNDENSKLRDENSQLKSEIEHLKVLCPPFHALPFPQPPNIRSARCRSPQNAPQKCQAFGMCSPLYWTTTCDCMHYGLLWQAHLRFPQAKKPPLGPRN